MDPVTVQSEEGCDQVICPNHFSSRRTATTCATPVCSGVMTDMCVSGCVQTEQGGAKLRDTRCQRSLWRDGASCYWPCHRHRDTLKQICSTMFLQCNFSFFHALSRATLLRALMFSFSKLSRRNAAKRRERQATPPHAVDELRCHWSRSSGANCAPCGTFFSVVLPHALKMVTVHIGQQ